MILSSLIKTIELLQKAAQITLLKHLIIEENFYS